MSRLEDVVHDARVLVWVLAWVWAAAVVVAGVAVAAAASVFEEASVVVDEVVDCVVLVVVGANAAAWVPRLPSVLSPASLAAACMRLTRGKKPRMLAETMTALSLLCRVEVGRFAMMSFIPAADSAAVDVLIMGGTGEHSARPQNRLRHTSSGLRKRPTYSFGGERNGFSITEAS